MRFCYGNGCAGSGLGSVQDLDLSTELCVDSSYNFDRGPFSLLKTGDHNFQCPHESAQTFSRPARIRINVKVPCIHYTTLDNTISNKLYFPYQAPIWVFDLYAVRLFNSQSGPDFIHVWDPATEQWIVTDVPLDGHPYDDGIGDSSFHEVIFDLETDSTFIYYNRHLIFEGPPIGDSGRVLLTGPSNAPWLVDMIVEDYECGGEVCLQERDCSNHGETTDMDNSDGCDCNCDDGYNGEHCETTKWVQIDNGHICLEDNLDQDGVLENINDFDECKIWCNDISTCHYFEFDGVNCYAKETCAPYLPNDNGRLVFQDTTQCVIEKDLLGSMAIQLLPSCRFTERADVNGVVLFDVVQIFLQVPRGFQFQKLYFGSESSNALPSDNCCDWGTICDGEMNYWAKQEIGCLDLYIAHLPLRTVYIPLQGRNSPGFVVEENVMKAFVNLQLGQRVYFLGDPYTRVLKLEMPFAMVLATEIELNINMTVLDPCRGVECPACQACNETDKRCYGSSDTDGEVCSDFNITTVDDKCKSGECVGTPLCSDENACAQCKKCQINYIGTIPNPGNPWSCVADFTQNGDPCDDGESGTINDICYNGVCEGEIPECDGCAYVGNPAYNCGWGLDPSEWEIGCAEDQTDCEGRPCCNPGFCNQCGTSYPDCIGGSCCQNDTTNPTCPGGDCHQWNSTNPSCNETIGCPGNCDFKWRPEMDCECGRCEFGFCIPDPPFIPDGTPCRVREPDNPGVCVNGKCEDIVTCAQVGATYCKNNCTCENLPITGVQCVGASLGIGGLFCEKILSCSPILLQDGLGNPTGNVIYVDMNGNQYIGNDQGPTDTTWLPDPSYEITSELQIVHGMMAIFNCSYGYRVTANYTIVQCNENYWNATIPQCEPCPHGTIWVDGSDDPCQVPTCPVPDHDPDNSFIVYQSGENVTYEEYNTTNGTLVKIHCIYPWRNYDNHPDEFQCIDGEFVPNSTWFTCNETFVVQIENILACKEESQSSLCENGTMTEEEEEEYECLVQKAFDEHIEKCEQVEVENEEEWQQESEGNDTFCDSEGAIYQIDMDFDPKDDYTKEEAQQLCDAMGFMCHAVVCKHTPTDTRKFCYVTGNNELIEDASTDGIIFTSYIKDCGCYFLPDRQMVNVGYNTTIWSYLDVEFARFLYDINWKKDAYWFFEVVVDIADPVDLEFAFVSDGSLFEEPFPDSHLHFPEPSRGPLEDKMLNIHWQFYSKTPGPISMWPLKVEQKLVTDSYMGVDIRYLGHRNITFNLTAFRLCYETDPVVCGYGEKEPVENSHLIPGWDLIKGPEINAKWCTECPIGQCEVDCDWWEFDAEDWVPFCELKETIQEGLPKGRRRLRPKSNINMQNRRTHDQFLKAEFRQWRESPEFEEEFMAKGVQAYTDFWGPRRSLREFRWAETIIIHPDGTVTGVCPPEQRTVSGYDTRYLTKWNITTNVYFESQMYTSFEGFLDLMMANYKIANMMFQLILNTQSTIFNETISIHIGFTNTYEEVINYDVCDYDCGIPCVGQGNNSQCFDLGGPLGRQCICDEYWKEYFEVIGCQDIDSCRDYNCTWNNVAECIDLNGTTAGQHGRVCKCVKGAYNYTETAGCVFYENCLDIIELIEETGGIHDGWAVNDELGCYNVDACELWPCEGGPNSSKTFDWEYCIDLPASEGYLNDEAGRLCVCIEGIGYHVNETTGVCEDIDECLTNPCGINSYCVNVDSYLTGYVNGFYCECIDGYFPIPESDPMSCYNPDACIDYDCAGNATCIDLVGPFDESGRICTCDTGFVYNNQTENCDEHDECQEHPCTGQALNYTVCIDHLGPDTGYTCSCNPNTTDNPIYNHDIGCSPVDQCESSPCKEGCTCVDLFDDHICECPECPCDWERFSTLDECGVALEDICCPEGHCDQSHCVSPCCFGGSCNQTQTSNCTCSESGGCNQVSSDSCICYGPSCHQDNSTDPICFGGECSQTNTTHPDCPGCGCDQTDAKMEVPHCVKHPHCPECQCEGTAPQCQICVDNEYVPDPHQFGDPCDEGHGICNSGECEHPCDDVTCASCEKCEIETGDCIPDPDMAFDPICFQMCTPEEIDACGPCKMCVAHLFPCVPNVDLNGSPCKKVGLMSPVCTEGECEGKFQPLEMVDSVIVSVGMQENDLNTLQANIFLEGLTSIKFPWKLILSEDFDVEGETLDFPVANDPKPEFGMVQDCLHLEGVNCVQRWSMSFTVEKICDVQSLYVATLWAQNVGGEIASLDYDLILSQAAICGVVIDDAPIEGWIKRTDSNYTILSDLQLFVWPTRINQDTAYFLLEAQGLVDIESMECLAMSLNIEGSIYITVGAFPNNEFIEDIELYYENVRGHAMQISFFLHPKWFDMSQSSDGRTLNIELTVTIRATYMQSERRRELRRLLASSDEAGYEFGLSVDVQPAMCTHGDNILIEVGGYAMVPCENDPTKEAYWFCSATGWDSEQDHNFCNPDFVEIGEIKDVEEMNLMNFIIIGSVSSAICILCLTGFLLLKETVPEETKDEFKKKKGLTSDARLSIADNISIQMKRKRKRRGKKTDDEKSEGGKTSKKAAKRSADSSKSEDKSETGKSKQSKDDKDEKKSKKKENDGNEDKDDEKEKKKKKKSGEDKDDEKEKKKKKKSVDESDDEKNKKKKKKNAGDDATLRKEPSNINKRSGAKGPSEDFNGTPCLFLHRLFLQLEPGRYSFSEFEKILPSIDSENSNSLREICQEKFLQDMRDC